METLQFDDTQLREELEQLPLRQRVVFAAACAERLMFPYVASSIHAGRGVATEFRSILTRLWEDLAGQTLKRFELVAKVDACVALISEDDNRPESTEPIYAEDAGVSVTHAMRCRLSGDSHEAVSAARCVYEELQHVVSRRLNVFSTSQEAEAQIAAHRLVQAELARQRRDLDDIRAEVSDDLWDLVDQVRTRAQRDSRALFSPPKTEAASQESKEGPATVPAPLTTRSVATTTAHSAATATGVTESVPAAPVPQKVEQRASEPVAEISVTTLGTGPATMVTPTFPPPAPADAPRATVRKPRETREAAPKERAPEKRKVTAAEPASETRRTETKPASTRKNVAPASRSRAKGSKDAIAAAEALLRALGKEIGLGEAIAILKRERKRLEATLRE